MAKLTLGPTEISAEVLNDMLRSVDAGQIDSY